MKTKLTFVIFAIFCSNLFAQTVSDVSDPNAIKINTPDKGIVVCGILHDCIANYPSLKDTLIAETAKKLAAEDEIAAQKRMSILQQQKVDLPKATVEAHNARIAKFAKAKEDALNAALKKTCAVIQADSTMSQDKIDAQIKAFGDARALAIKIKAKTDELVTQQIPISQATIKAVNDAQADPTPTPPPTATPTPDGL